MRVKTLMGLERFEVSIKSRPNSQSLGNYEGIEFGTKKNFAVSLLALGGIQGEASPRSGGVRPGEAILNNVGSRRELWNNYAKPRLVAQNIDPYKYQISDP